MIKGLLIDLGDTLIEQEVDDETPLSSMNLVLFSDAQPTLAQLKAHGYLIAVVTNTSQSNAVDVAKALERLGLLQFVDAVVTSTDVGVEKPDPRMFQAALEKLQLPAREAAMIGDDLEKDILGAQRLGMTTILVNRNKTTIDLKETSISVVKSLDEALQLLIDQHTSGSPDQVTSGILSFNEDNYGQ
jgi:HAD superfamily hydrolase (TIGR01662 family)